jgi:A/G-specific adenine glycosylase
MSLSPQAIKTFQDKILTWYSLHQRELPWRELPLDPKTGMRDPYKILLSEIMSQQTQISRVVPKYRAWLEAFPTVEALAIAPVADVLKHWSGLGYNRRALNLKKTAQVIVEQHGGKFPKTEKELLALPGIGLYTARAIMCFAFDEQVAVVDVNVKKVIVVELFGNMRLGDSSRDPSTPFRSPQGNKMSDKEIALIADSLVPHGRAYEWNQALMDYSAKVLKKEKMDIPKQSTFKGSRRFYRGQIVKLLIEKHEVALSGVGKFIKKDYTEEDRELISSIVAEMEKEGFIRVKNGSITLSS